MSLNVKIVSVSFCGVMQKRIENSAISFFYKKKNAPKFLKIMQIVPKCHQMMPNSHEH